MSKLPRRKPRCMVCGLHVERCFCATLPRLCWNADLIVVQHRGERYKPTGTGRLACRLLDNATLVAFGGLGDVVPPEPFQRPETDYAVLYPAPDAPPLGPQQLRPRSGRRQAFVLLDGTWSQAARMVRRVPHVRDLPVYALPAGERSRWGIRRPRRPDQICTLETALRLAELRVGVAAVQPLQEAFQRVVAELEVMRGKGRPAEVSRPAEDGFLHPGSAPGGLE